MSDSGQVTVVHAWNNPSPWKTILKWNIFERLEQFIALKSDPQAVMRGVPGLRNNSSLWKTISEMEYFCVPETIHLWKTILKWKNVVRLEQFMYDSLKNDPQVENVARLEQFMRWKTILKLKYVVRLKQFMHEKRSSSGNARRAWNNSCLVHWKSILKWKYKARLEQFIV